MDLKEAVRILRDNLEIWKHRKGMGEKQTLYIGDSWVIPVAETLLAALEGEPEHGTFCVEIPTSHPRTSSAVWLGQKLEACPYCKGEVLTDIWYDRKYKNPFVRHQKTLPEREGKPADPSTLDGRTVDGWGWKVFRGKTEVSAHR